MVDTEKSMNISFFIPAYNCESFVEEAVESIMNGNFGGGDELIIVNNASTDNTGVVLERLKRKYPETVIAGLPENNGPAPARNLAVNLSRNPFLFNLDADNVLEKKSIPVLKDFLIQSHSDAACFGEIHFFCTRTTEVVSKWVFKEQPYTFQDYLSLTAVPGASGNYLFTRESWERAGGYPQYSLDVWGFGLRQAATGSQTVALPNTHYYHRQGHQSYWLREYFRNNFSQVAREILTPFLDRIDENDVAYIQGEGRESWYLNLDKRPVKVKSC
jgi:glycosyltransferase involved in cell wall biosynthesis